MPGIPPPRRELQGGHELLVTRIASGDTGALIELHRRCSTPVLAIALSIVRDHATAEEVASDTFLQIWRDAARYLPERGSVMAWVSVIARSRALDALRRRAPIVAHETAFDESVHGMIAAIARTPLETMEQGDRSNQLHRLIRRLEPPQRQVLVLAFFKDLTNQEVAMQSGLPLGTVKSHLRRTLRRLQGDCVSAMLTVQG